MRRQRIINLFLTLLELARFDRPIGILAILFPCLYGFIYGTLTMEYEPEYRDTFTYRMILICISATIFRAVGCIWNDIVDIDIDRHVKRTRSRPLARGATSVSTAYYFAAGLLAVGSLSLVPLVPDLRCLVAYYTPMIVMIMVYPYCKRITDYAQVFLGVTLGWGVLFGAATAGLDVFDVNFAYSVGGAHEPRVEGVFGLYASCLVWTVVYDTIYGFQDVGDDRRIGIRSTAVRFHESARLVLLMLACGQITLLVYVGERLAVSRGGQHGYVLQGLAAVWWYTSSTVVMTACLLLTALLKVDFESPQSCSFWFKMLSITVGSSIGAGLLFQFLADCRL